MYKYKLTKKYQNHTYHPISYSEVCKELRDWPFSSHISHKLVCTAYFVSFCSEQNSSRHRADFPTPLGP